MVIDRQETLRYLGYQGAAPDLEVSALLDTALAEVAQAAVPRWVEDVFPVRHTGVGTLTIGSIVITSHKLSQNLADCHSAVVLAATLGVGVDRLLRRTTQLDMAKTLLLQAAATAAIEGVCDALQHGLSERFLLQGLYLRPRFSPGYGDFALTHQRDVLALLQASKRIGLTLTDSLLLMPIKSVTAVIGLSDHDRHCNENSCQQCENTQCSYRKEDS